MKKDNIRDYATEAFRFYAICGRLTAEELKQRVKDDIYRQSRREFFRGGSGMPSDATAYAAIAAEDAVREMQAELEDILAVEKTMQRLDRPQRMAVEIVYFADAQRPLERNDISDRVHRAEMEIPASEKSVYRYLKKAREIFAEERGLRISKKSKNFFKVDSSRP